MFFRLTALAVLLGGWSLLVFGQWQEHVKGRDLFDRRCGGCHALDRNKEGPSLRGVYGRAAGSVDTFGYSDALKRSGIVWDEASLEKWLSDPEQLVPGTEMAFHLENAEERREIIAYLRKNSGR